MTGHPHVEWTIEAEREAASGLVELHRGDADIHHDTVDGFDTLGRTDLGEIREAVLDQRQPYGRPVNQFQAACDGGAVTVDADHFRARCCQDHAAIAAGAKGRINVDATLAGAEHLHRLAAKHGNMADGFAHAPAPGERESSKLGSNGPIAPRIPGLSSAFRRKLPNARTIADPARPRGQTLVSAWNLLGCHRVSSMTRGAKPVLALHHLVTTRSVKKRLMKSLTFVERCPVPGRQGR